MAKGAGVVAAAWVLGLAKVGGAEEAPGWCDWVEGSAASEAALRASPEVFARFGSFPIEEGTGSGATPSGRNLARVTAGATYSSSGLYQSFLLRNRAAAECRKYRAEVVLKAAIAGGPDVGRTGALSSRIRLLDATRPQAEEIVATVRTEVEKREATVRDLESVQLHLDALHAQSVADAMELVRVRALPPVPDTPLAVALDDYRAADLASEAYSAQIRQAGGWDVGLRGGLDYIIDGTQGVPLFGMVTFSFNPGTFWQTKADARAREGRQRWLTEDLESYEHRVQELRESLNATHDVEEKRRQTVAALAKDLSDRLAEADSLSTAAVRRYREVLWFELNGLRAEEAYLTARGTALDAFLATDRRNP